MKRIIHYFCLAAAFAGILAGAGSCDTYTRHHRGNLDPEYPDDPSRPGDDGPTENRDITLKVGYGEYWGQWYNDNSDSYLIYLYEGKTDNDGNFTDSAHMLTLDILLPKRGEMALRDGVYQCSDKKGMTQIFIPAYDSTDENGQQYLDGSTLYVQRDRSHSNLYGITDGTLRVTSLVTGNYEIEAEIVTEGGQYTFHYKGAIKIEDKTSHNGGDNGFPGSDTYQLKAKALYNGEVYDGSDDYTLYLYYGEYLDNGDFKTVGTETVLEFLTKKTGTMAIVPGTYTCTGTDFTPGHVLEGLEEDGTVYPSYIYRQYDNQGDYSLELITDATLEIGGSASASRIKVYFKTASGSFACEYEGPVEMIDNRQADVPKDVEMKNIKRVLALDCGQVWDGIECTDYRDWILYFYDKDAESTNEYTCVEFLTEEKVKGALPDMKLGKVVQVGNPKDFVPGVIIGGYTDDDSVAWGTWYCKGGTAWYAATKGSLEVKRTGDNYSLSFDFVDEDETYGGTFKGSYTGPVEFKVDQAASAAARRSAAWGFSPSRGAKAARAAAGSGRRAVGAGRAASVPDAPAASLRSGRTMPKVR